MKIRLVAPPYSSAPELVPPLGLLSIASYLKSSLTELPLDIQVIDCAGVDVNDYDVPDQIIRDNVDVVGFPVYSQYVSVVTKWASYIKERSPNIILIAGGPHVSLTWKHFTNRWGHLFDYTIAGDGEIPFTSLINSLAAKNRPMEIPGLGWLSESKELINCGLPGPQLPAENWPNPFDAELITLAKSRPVFIDPFNGQKRDAVTLVNSRSCPMRCSFCSIITVSQKWIAADVNDVIKWLEFEYSRKPFEHIYFLDANFFVQSKRVCEIAELIRERLPGVTWSALSTVLMFLKMKSYIPLLIDCGLRMVELGIESGSQRQLDIMQKDCKVEKNFEAVNVLQQYGLRIGLDYIMFYPEQTIEDLQDNLSFLIDSGLVSQLDDFDHYFNALILYPGTPLRHKYSKLFEKELDPDFVPPCDDLFVDESIKSIYRLTMEFCKHHMGWIKQGVKNIRTLITEMDSHDLDPITYKRAQKLRLDFISLKHLPLKVIWHLIDHHNYDSIAEAMPQLFIIQENLKAIEDTYLKTEFV